MSNGMGAWFVRVVWSSWDVNVPKEWNSHSSTFSKSWATHACRKQLANLNDVNRTPFTILQVEKLPWKLPYTQKRRKYSDKHLVQLEVLLRVFLEVPLASFPPVGVTTGITGLNSALLLVWDKSTFLDLGVKPPGFHCLLVYCFEISSGEKAMEREEGDLKSGFCSNE